MFKNYIPDQVLPYIAEVKDSIKYRFGNRISFKTDRACDAFADKLFTDKYTGLITQDFDYEIYACSQNVITFCKPE